MIKWRDTKKNSGVTLWRLKGTAHFLKTFSQMVTNDNVSTLTAGDEQYGALLKVDGLLR